MSYTFCCCFFSFLFERNAPGAPPVDTLFSVLPQKGTLIPNDRPTQVCNLAYTLQIFVSYSEKLTVCLLTIIYLFLIFFSHCLDISASKYIAPVGNALPVFVFLRKQTYFDFFKRS